MTQNEIEARIKDLEADLLTASTRDTAQLELIGKLEAENKELKRKLNAKQTFWICPSCGSNTDVEFPEYIAELQAENKRLREAGVAFIESCNHEGGGGDYDFFCELRGALSKDSE